MSYSACSDELPQPNLAEHRDPLSLRRANATASKARGAFHRPVSPQPPHTRQGATSSKSVPLAASHLSALTRGASPRGDTPPGHLSAPTSDTGLPFVNPAAQQLPFGAHYAPTTDMFSRLVSQPLDLRPSPSCGPMPPVGFCRPNEPRAHQRTPFASTISSHPEIRTQRLSTPCSCRDHLAALTAAEWLPPLRASASRVTSSQGSRCLAAPRTPALRPHAAQALPQPTVASSTSRHRPLPHAPGIDT